MYRSMLLKAEPNAFVYEKTPIRKAMAASVRSVTPILFLIKNVFGY